MISVVKCITLFFVWVSTTICLENRTMYLLLWNNDQAYTHDNKLNSRRVGSDIFSDCKYRNCYLTDDKNFFGVGKVTEFDGILFNGKTLSMKTRKDQLPQERLHSQKYVYLCAEPICNSSFYRKPNVCNPVLYELFNMTGIIYVGLNYEIDFGERDKDYSGLKDNRRSFDSNIIDSVCENQLPTNETLLLRNKKKAVMWAMSNCTGVTNKDVEYTINLTKSLESYGQKFDIYGCGYGIQCPVFINGTSECDYNKLKDEYFFYFDFDHGVDDKTKSCPVASLSNHSVPIFYGKFHSRYLPLGTYIDAEYYKPETLASEIVYLINHPRKYNDFFRFRNRSVPYYPVNAHYYPCRVCKAFNSKRYMDYPHTCHYVSPKWYPDIKNLCKPKYDYDYNG